MGHNVELQKMNLEFENRFGSVATSAQHHRMCDITDVKDLYNLSKDQQVALYNRCRQDFIYWLFNVYLNPGYTVYPESRIELKDHLYKEAVLMQLGHGSYLKTCRQSFKDGIFIARMVYNSMYGLRDSCIVAKTNPDAKYILQRYNEAIELQKRIFANIEFEGNTDNNFFKFTNVICMHNYRNGKEVKVEADSNALKAAYIPELRTLELFVFDYGYIKNLDTVIEYFDNSLRGNYILHLNGIGLNKEIMQQKNFYGNNTIKRIQSTYHIFEENFTTIPFKLSNFIITKTVEDIFPDKVEVMKQLLNNEEEIIQRELYCKDI